VGVHSAFGLAPALPAAAPTPIGVGFPYLPGLPVEIYRSGLVDFVELTPETLCRERRDGPARTLSLVPAHVERAQEVCGPLPITVHGVELSIGSALGWNDAYVAMLDRLWAEWPFRWHSAHLGWQTVPDEAGGAGGVLEVGVPLPLPPTVEAAALVASRAAALGVRYPVPFLLENPAHYLADLPGDDEIEGETGLMNRITEDGGCWQLLDLHNLYCNSLNFAADVRALLGGVRLDRVIEIHVAGGSWREGVYMDGHDGRVPEPVWELLEEVLPRAENVAGLVFEVADEPWPRLEPDVIEGELERARQIWRAHRGVARGAGVRG
jgi:uncharacterized protein (UPF0276 family)